ncbi:hypothetical protein [Amycolatopsis sp. NPDC059657]|uniref:hypothetical protein n=1 Tax=Amycolatopsis sp. NPDC059657 TaxID=3346899 RepID=UPI00366BE791
MTTTDAAIESTADSRKPRKSGKPFSAKLARWLLGPIYETLDTASAYGLDRRVIKVAKRRAITWHLFMYATTFISAFVGLWIHYAIKAVTGSISGHIISPVGGLLALAILAAPVMLLYCLWVTRGRANLIPCRASSALNRCYANLDAVLRLQKIELEGLRDWRKYRIARERIQRLLRVDANALTKILSAVASQQGDDALAELQYLGRWLCWTSENINDNYRATVAMECTLSMIAHVSGTRLHQILVLEEPPDEATLRPLKRRELVDNAIRRLESRLGLTLVAGVAGAIAASFKLFT